MHRIAVTSATLTLMLSACTGGGETLPTEPEAGDPVRPSATMDDPSPSGATGSLSPELIERVIEQAVEDTGVSADEIGVVMAEAVTWTDGSLGCPEEGMMYTQALVDGYRVVLDVAGEEIHYHSGPGADFFACANPQGPTDR